MSHFLAVLKPSILQDKPNFKANDWEKLRFIDNFLSFDMSVEKQTYAIESLFVWDKGHTFFLKFSNSHTFVPKFSLS